MGRQLMLQSMSESLLTESLPELIQHCDALLVDMDGCLIASGQALPGARDLIELAGDKLWLVSNNSSHSAGELSSELSALGLNIPPQSILLAGELALAEARRRYGEQPMMILARQAFRDHADSLGVNQCDDKPKAIILTRDLDLNYARLTLAIRHLSHGVPLIVANPDLTHPDRDGYPVPETGSLLALLRAAVPDLNCHVLGKPGPELFEAALQRAGARAEHSLMIGDNPNTDIAGAEALGIHSLLIGKDPAALAKDIAGLLQAELEVDGEY